MEAIVVIIAIFSLIAKLFEKRANYESNKAEDEKTHPFKPAVQTMRFNEWQDKKKNKKKMPSTTNERGKKLSQANKSPHPLHRSTYSIEKPPNKEVIMNTSTPNSFEGSKDKVEAFTYEGTYKELWEMETDPLSQSKQRIKSGPLPMMSKQNDGDVLPSESLRSAMIWMTILDKPRALEKHKRFP